MQHETYYDWGDLESDDEIHRICKPFDPDVFDDCPDERPDHYDDPVDPNLLLDEDIVPLRTQPTSKTTAGSDAGRRSSSFRPPSGRSTSTSLSGRWSRSSDPRASARALSPSTMPSASPQGDPTSGGTSP